MRAVVQRASSARVVVAGKTVGELPRPGLLILVGMTHRDGDPEIAVMARKLSGLRILADAETGRMDRSALDLGAPLLLVSQFTLYGDTRKGRRPTWSAAMGGEEAEPMFDALVEALRGTGLEVATGEFGADMDVELVNDGPVTLLVEV